MATHIQHMAQWAVDLHLAQCPPSVIERARLQHVHHAANVRGVAGSELARALRRAVPHRGTAALVMGGVSTRRGAALVHGALAAWLEQDDAILTVHTGAGAVPAAWAASRGRAVDEVLRATIAANEIAGRIGLSMLLSPTTGLSQTPVLSVAAAVTAGLLMGLDADALGHALALALEAPAVTPWRTTLAGDQAKAWSAGGAVAAGLDAVERAQAGAQGALDALDHRDGWLGSMAWVPLRAAFTGLGVAWLTAAMAYKHQPLADPVQVPVQAVHEILRRHVRAAGRHLRPEQLERVELSVAAPAWLSEQRSSGQGGYLPASVPWSIRRSIGVLVAAHELGVESLGASWLLEHRDAVADIARRVRVRHDWDRSAALAQAMTRTLSPLLVGVKADELRQVGGRLRALHGALPTPDAMTWLRLVASRPARWLADAARSTGDLGAVDPATWRLPSSTEVRLFTTRGGAWPERRELAEGAPGWPWEQTVARVLAAHPDGAVLVETPGGQDAAGWAEALLR